jgi:hypothetical protein
VNDKPLLTDDEIDELAEMSDAMRGIVSDNLPQSDAKVTDLVDHLVGLLKIGADRDEIRKLTDELDPAELYEWAAALRDGSNAIDKLAMRLDGETVEDDDEDDRGPLAS